MKMHVLFSLGVFAGVILAGSVAMGMITTDETLPCPEITYDAIYPASGTHASTLWTDALGGAGNACAQEYNACQISQANELAINRALCESVKGCVLEYRLDNDICEEGSAENCTPAPGTEPDPSTTVYSCTINGKFNYTDYRCAHAPVIIEPEPPSPIMGSMSYLACFWLES